MEEEMTTYEQDHDFDPQLEIGTVCKVCGLSLPIPFWGRVLVWGFSGYIPGKCYIPPRLRLLKHTSLSFLEALFPSWLPYYNPEIGG